MGPESFSNPRTVEFDRGNLQDDAPAVRPDVAYRPAPYSERAGGDSQRPVWRVRFDVLTEPRGSFGLDINGEVIFGRGDEQPNQIDLSPYNAEKMGVSRSHLILRPTENKLFALDTGSTNGTLRNAHSIGVNTPYGLNSGDVLTLGQLQMMVSIIQRPKSDTSILRERADLGEALTDMVKAIASQLEVDEVLGQAVEAALGLTSASETAIWLVDEETSELFLEAECGIHDEEVRRMRLPVSDSLAGKVIATGEPLIVSREASKTTQIKGASPAGTIIYVPVRLGGVTLGVLAAAHRDGAREFTPRDQTVLETIADFAAIALQNSRIYEAAALTLARRVEELAALNELSRTVSASLDPIQVYNMLTEQVRKHWHIGTVSLWLVDERSKSLNLVSGSEGERAKVSRLTQEIVQRVMKSGEPLLLADLMRQAPAYAVQETQEIRSELAVPIKLQDRVLGVLDLQTPDLNRFTPADVSALQTAADQLGVAIQNAQLYRQVQRQTEVLTTNVERRTEDLHAANEHLEALSRLKDEFIANVSHELRTPITNLKLLQDALRTSPPRRRDRYMDAMQRETNRLERIVEDLFRLSRLDQGQVALEPAPVDLNAIVHQYVSDRTSMAENRGLTLTHSSQAGLPTLMADESLLGQTLSILLTNALNYTPSGGSVKIGTHAQVIDGQRWVGFSVSDTGPGISPEEQPFLFERFFRGKVGRESGTSGAGLGLAIVKEVVELHGGRVEVDSEGVPGKGTTFTVWLPLAGAYGANLLLVDDDETMLDVMEEILAATGYEVWAAHSGEAALALLLEMAAKEESPDLVIADVVMSGMTGLQLAEEMRAKAQWANIPFLFISASTTLAMDGQISGLDNVTYLRKPFDSETLQQTVAGAIAARPDVTKRER